jgi:hypothetical protein
LNLKPGCLL